MRLKPLLLAAIFIPSLLHAATVSKRGGKPIEGEIQGTVVQRVVGTDGILYTLLPGGTITTIDAAGVHIFQKQRTGPEDATPSAVITVSIPSSKELDPKLEVTLLAAAASADFEKQMEGMMTFRIETGLSVTRAEDYHTTVSKAPLYGVLLPDAAGLARSLTVNTASGPVSIALDDIAQ